MRADGFKDLEEKFETISNQIIDSLAEIPCKRLFDFYECYYACISRLCRYINHLGYRCYLISGRLLNSVRDSSVALDKKDCPYTMNFCVLDVPPDYGGIWDVVREYVDNDVILNWDPGPELDSEYSPMWFSSNYTDVENNYINVPVHSCDTANIMQFNLSCEGYSEFPLQQIEFSRYKYVKDLDMYVNGYTPHYEVDYINKLWFGTGSVVDLYGSSYLTLNNSYFELYFNRKYGSNWRTPVSQMKSSGSRFDSGVWHK